jgi:hypothetical protein
MQRIERLIAAVKKLVESMYALSMELFVHVNSEMKISRWCLGALAFATRDMTDGVKRLMVVVEEIS